ncbi:MAG TPA: MFS transporter [Candidatus Limnocylindria bacterium]|jgi:MFS family permease
MLQVLRQRNFALLWFGGLISMVGDWVLFVGLPYEIYRQTGSTLATGGMVLALLIPRIAFGSVAGVYVDRWDRRRLMIAVNLLLAAFLIPLLAVNALGLWVIYVVLIVESTLEQLFTPAEVALLPNLLEGGDEQLIPANALSGVNRHLARLIGPLIGGVVVAVGGLTAIAVVDAASFLVAAGLIAAIRYLAPPRPVHPPMEEEVVSAWRRLIGEWREGLRVVWHQRVLRALLVFFVITSVGEGLTATLFVPWVTDALHSNSAGYGALLSTQAIGGLAGALVIGRFGARVSPVRLLIVGALTFGAIDLVLFTYPVVFPFLAPALVGMVIVGVPGAAIGAGSTTLQQSQAADRHRGRVIGAIGALAGVGSLVGAILAGLLGEVLPVILLLVVQGSGYVIGGVLVALMVRPRVAVA